MTGLYGKYAKMGFKKGWKALKADLAKKKKPKKSRSRNKKLNKKKRKATRIFPRVTGFKNLITKGGTMARRKRRSSSAKAGKGFGKMNIGGEIQNIGMGAAGAVAGAIVGNMIPLPDARMKAGLPIIGGIVLSLVMGKKNAMMKKIGLGMSIGGALALVRSLAPNVPLLAGEEAAQLAYSPEDVERALITGQITPAEAQTLLESPEMLGASTEFAGEEEAIEYAPADEWQTSNDQF